MDLELFGGRHDSKIEGMIECFDRVMIKGTLPTCCHAGALENTLWSRNILFKDYTGYANDLRNEVRAHIEALAERERIPIHHLRSRGVRKEDFVRERIAADPDKEGIVCILSTMEKCLGYAASKNEKTGFLGMRYRDSQCLHYYVYFDDPELGLCFVAFPTWVPFTVRVYFNGHNWLARQMQRAGIGYEMDDNCFTRIEDYAAAQELADSLEVKSVLHPKLKRWMRQLCPVAQREFGDYHFSLHEVEYATDVVFDSVESLAPVYKEVVHTAVCEVKHADVATFLGRRLGGSKLEGAANLTERNEGTSVRHRLGKAAIKMYDKKGKVLRVESVLNDVSFLRTFREVRHKDGTTSRKNAPVKKSIYSLGDLRGLMGRANRRYLTHVGGLEERSAESAALVKLTSPVTDRNTKRTVRGLSFFGGDDKLLLTALLEGEYRLTGITNRRLRSTHLKGWSSGKVSRALKRLRLHGLIRKIANTHTYHLTKLANKILAVMLKIQTRIFIPALAS